MTMQPRKPLTINGLRGCSVPILLETRVVSYLIREVLEIKIIGDVLILFQMGYNLDIKTLGEE